MRKSSKHPKPVPAPKQWEPKGKEPVRQHYAMAAQGVKGEKK